MTPPGQCRDPHQPNQPNEILKAASPPGDPKTAQTHPRRARNANPPPPPEPKLTRLPSGTLIVGRGAETLKKEQSVRNGDNEQEPPPAPPRGGGAFSQSHERTFTPRSAQVCEHSSRRPPRVPPPPQALRGRTLNHSPPRPAERRPRARHQPAPLGEERRSRRGRFTRHRARPRPPAELNPSTANTHPSRTAAATKWPARRRPRP